MAERRSLIDRPVQVVGKVDLQQGDPNAIEAQILRFGGGLLGNQEPGDLPSALGAATGLLPIERILSFLSGAKGMTNLGDKALRAHMDPQELEQMFQGQRMREFLPVGGEQTGRPMLKDTGKPRQVSQPFQKLKDEGTVPNKITRKK